MCKITVIGAGHMGGAFAKGLLKSGINAEITVTVRHMERANEIKSEMPAVTVDTDNRRASAGADIIVLAVKPWQVQEIISEIKSNFTKDTILISFAAGVFMEEMHKMMNDCITPAAFYAIPNIAAEYNKSMTFLSPAADCSQEAVSKAKALLEKVGKVMVCKEELTHAGMLMASCGLAYIIRILRIQSEAGVEMGFRPEAALEIAMQTMDGATSLLSGTDEHPEAIIDRVTTPGGYTIKGLNEMNHSGVASAIIKTFKTGYK